MLCEFLSKVNREKEGLHEEVKQAKHGPIRDNLKNIDMLKSMGTLKVFASLAIFSLFLTQVEASYTYGFDRITSLGLIDVASQLSVEVVNSGSNQVQFNLRNDNSIVSYSSIVEIYFDDDSGTIQGFDATNPLEAVGGNVNISRYSVGSANPGFLQGQGTIGFNPTPGLLADSNGHGYGVNDSSDVLGMLFDLNTGQTYDDVIAALDGSTLRVGIQVRKINGINIRDSFVSNELLAGPNPEPGTLALLALGLGAILLNKRRKLKQ